MWAAFWWPLLREAALTYTPDTLESSFELLWKEGQDPLKGASTVSETVSDYCTFQVQGRQLRP